MEHDKSTAVFRSTNTAFMDSDVLFVEYMDCLNLEWLNFLAAFKDTEDSEEFPFDLEPIKYMDLESLFVWYLKRKNRNPLMDLVKENFDIEEIVVDEFLKNELLGSDVYTDVEFTTNVNQLVHLVLNNGFAKRIIIYNEYPDPYLEKSVTDEYTSKVEFVTGDFDTVVSSLPDVGVTYIFSDIEKVETLSENEKIAYNSVVIPNDYAYNKTDDGEWLVDFVELGKRALFKFAFMKMCE